MLKQVRTEEVRLAHTCFTCILSCGQVDMVHKNFDSSPCKIETLPGVFAGTVNVRIDLLDEPRINRPHSKFLQRLREAGDILVKYKYSPSDSIGSPEW
jgi:hypothetical protein